MSDLSVLLTHIGLTGGQAVGFVVTIATSLWAANAAKSTSRESRRQHTSGIRQDQLLAAGLLIDCLSRFEQSLEEIFYDNINCNQMFDHHISIDTAQLRPDVLQLAAKLGPDILTKFISLEASRSKAERTIKSIGTILGRDDAEDETTAHSALLILQSADLAGEVSEKVGIAVSLTPSVERERLVEAAKPVTDRNSQRD
ncbi:hypothetical protein ACTZWT_09990 [Rhodopseudomonas sp. NSM]|uniref:hypothetical protein n=1 Tax=Rhodopseudomonas sp. NSM TaxID=3457630 RepID=UPI004035B632